MAKRPSKSESLTIRLDPKTRFMLDFVARLRGQSITTVVERAISAAADAAEVTKDGNVRNWRFYWDVNDGIRAIRIARTPNLHPTYEEDKRLRFTEFYWPFFYLDNRRQTLNPTALDVLWPIIDELVALYDEMKTQNIEAPAEVMVARLSAAKIEVPDWQGRLGIEKEIPWSRGQELDDTLPF